ncbi:AzlD domain-containing protein [Nonomuraea rubra]|uniref:AzlD domain-containing protein n=1 Tax=Nonomuraea rubra TaxID=46180 RepID=UPI0033DA7DF4
MTATLAWASVAGLVLVTLLLKAFGPVVAAGRRLPGWFPGFVGLLTPALLAMLVVTQLLGSPDGNVVLDARLAGLAAAVIAWRLKVPTLWIVVIAAATTALTRLIS